MQWNENIPPKMSFGFESNENHIILQKKVVNSSLRVSLLYLLLLVTTHILDMYTWCTLVLSVKVK